MSQRILRLVGVVGLASTLVLSAAGTAQAAAHWQIQQRLAPTAQIQGTDVASVATTSSHSVWAVGSQTVNEGSKGLIMHPFVEHWNGHAWKTITAPATPSGARFGSELRQVVAGTHGVWVVGSADFGRTDDGGTFVARWTGSGWVEHVFGVNRIITHLAVFGVHNVWALGFRDSTSQRHAISSHWNGHGWTSGALPAVPEYDSTGSVGQLAPSWVPAYRPTARKPALLHWTGHAWKRAAMPKVALPKGARNYFITNVLDRGKGNVWLAIAYGGDESLVPGLTLFHHTGTGWHRTLNLRRDAPDGLSSDGGKGLWLISSGVRPTTQLLHVTRNGTKVAARVNPPHSHGLTMQFGAISRAGKRLIAIGGFYGTSSATSSAAIAAYTP